MYKNSTFLKYKEYPDLEKTDLQELPAEFGVGSGVSDTIIYSSSKLIALQVYNKEIAINHIKFIGKDLLEQFADAKERK